MKFGVFDRMFDARVGNEVPKARMILDMTGVSIQKLWTPKGNQFYNESNLICRCFKFEIYF